MKMLLLLLVAILAISVPAFAGRLTNGTYEAAGSIGDNSNTGRAGTGWTSWLKVVNGTDPVSITYGVQGTNTQGGKTTNPRTGLQAATVRLKGGDGGGAYFGIYQTITGLTIGRSYTLSSWVETHSDLARSATTYWGYELFLVQGGMFTVKPDTTQAYASGKSDNMLNTGSTNAYVQFSKSFVAAGSTYTAAWLSLINCSTSPSNSYVMRIDDVEMTPEPSSMLAMMSGFVGLVAYGIRRKR